MATCASPLGPVFFIFMQFLEHIGRMIGWLPLLSLASPCLANPGSTTGYSTLEKCMTTWAVFSQHHL